MIRVAQIQFGKHGSVGQGFEGRTQEGKRVLIFDSDVVKLSIVYARSQTAIFLGNKEKIATGEEDGFIMPDAKDSEI